MADCGFCAGTMSEGGVACDGVCGRLFHAACLRRGTRSSSATTCAECSDIKPCHVLRLVKSITESFSTDLALVADRFASPSTRLVDLQLVSDDIAAINTKVDRLTGVVVTLESNSNILLERSQELSSRVRTMSGFLDDIHAVLAVLDPGLVSSMGSSPLLPVVEDLRRSVRQVKGDLGSWSAAASSNSDLLTSVASEVKALTERFAAIPPPTPLPPPTEGDCVGLPRSDLAPQCPAPPDEGHQGATLADSGNPSALTEAIVLRPAKRPKCVFISRIHPDTSERDIVDHISTRAGVPIGMIACRKFAPARGRVGCSFTASFKAFVPEEAFAAVVAPDIWPPGSIVREFTPRTRVGPTPQSKNLSVGCLSVTPT